ncbi:MAG: bis(5'-nucleosyl)-tetraphosphatase (symmetrical) YqeK [Lachnospiraceae bacterium]|nr:bis(5'-nucleosyl)-tetraphosphatase (symmetrical) YqeK [Lachnospiraceae bacterium]
MKVSDINKLRKAMEKELESKRYEHTLSVAYTAANLAMVYGEEVDKALTAGMLHDCAKCMSHSKQIAVCAKNHVQLSEAESVKNSPLIHAKAGSVVARTKYQITDEDILNAICYHTTGRPNMSMLEKIVYIADYIEPGRKHAENLPQIRRLAYQDLDAALCNILKDTLAYLSKKGGQVDPMTQKTYDCYVNQKTNNGENIQDCK